MSADVIARFHRALPEVRRWIDQCLESHATRACKLDPSPALAQAYPPEVLARARVVLVDRTPFPPVSRFGLPEFAAHEGREFDGITFKDTFFVLADRLTPRLQFHELVHVVQWARLGVDKFLLSYGLGLLQYGYEGSPLERMAYELEEQFARGEQPTQLVRFIEEGSDAIWSQVARVVGTPVP